jgi:acetyl esterase/lipase
VLQTLHKAHINCPTRLPHPHLPPKTDAALTRFLGTRLVPTAWCSYLRDSGAFRSMVDGIVTATVPSLAIASPSAAVNFLKLSSECLRFRYGQHPRHTVDVFLPKDTSPPKGLVFFVHGGAWGSGLPWMYRLTALPFLKLGLAVAVVGYRVYPDANVSGQVADLELAAHEIERRYRHLYHSTEFGAMVVGHSSGAHIALMMIMERAQRMRNGHVPIPMPCSTFIGISGPYDISHHFDFEAARGVEELSPMKPACGYTRNAFRDNSPAYKLIDMLTSMDETRDDLNSWLPELLLVHGMDDGTVPFTATAEAARIIKSCGVKQCTELYLAKTGHEQAVMELMLGGTTTREIVKWLLLRSNRTAGPGGAKLHTMSRL